MSFVIDLPFRQVNDMWKRGQKMKNWVSDQTWKSPGWKQSLRKIKLSSAENFPARFPKTLTWAPSNQRWLLSTPDLRMPKKEPRWANSHLVGGRGGRPPGAWRIFKGVFSQRAWVLKVWSRFFLKPKMNLGFETHVTTVHSAQVQVFIKMLEFFSKHLSSLKVRFLCKKVNSGFTRFFAGKPQKIASYFVRFRGSVGKDEGCQWARWRPIVWAQTAA